ncbi:helicase-exonuclease AddAB subunit AddA [Aeribacillus alveayuensis]|uniref:ATP-dependent helicase/nuclease subunit A n=1 Tax=Aeribacillus alveayuensis TaxID=279215 RepID=A0ABT9VN11_9BACI|nr:ATP-dependent helicase/nuclease subunit A [Bacillus alveayuensis]
MSDIFNKPENSQWTDDQWKAIVSTGKDILVAAAAGSGKTAVLVERIIRKIISRENPVDVDRLLIVTFTNASAAEMRNRIGEALEKALKENPASLHLRRQLTLLNKANISTLHSFCLNVVRKYYYKIDLDPGFRIGDETEIELLIDEVLDDLFEKQYGLEGNEPFFDLVDRYTSDRSDEDLQSLIRSLYLFSRSHPTPDKWLDEIMSMYQYDDTSSFEGLPFFQYLQRDVKMELEGCIRQLERALEMTKLPGGPAPRAENLIDDMEQIRQMIEAPSWEALADAVRSFKPTRAKPCRGDEYLQDLIDQVIKLRDGVKKQIQKLHDELFARDIPYQLEDLKKMAPVISVLVNLVKEFSKRFEAVKKEKALVDFSDLEHYCLQILTDEDENGNVIPSDAARSYQQQFVEVLVDEYQDTNLVQEAILKLVTSGPEHCGNMFMVGDVKQSIYRFRLAEPFLFLSKYKRFTKDGEKTGLRIDLAKNFRSRTEVLDSTNYIFKQVMGENVGEITYDEAAELKLGATYPEHDEMKTELYLIDRGQEDDKALEDNQNPFEQEELETSQLEGRLMAKKIKQLIQQQFPVYDRKLNRTRPITYRDIVILLRAMSWAPQIMEEFKKQGIPVYADLRSGYFEATEVSIMMSLLKVIDNPFQDIPLASVLRSPVVGLTANELAIIRLYKKKGAYYEALKIFLQQAQKEDEHVYEKVKPFYEDLRKWRDLARKGPVSHLIWQLYRDTRFFDFVGGMPGGKQRQANLRALYDRARQYEETSFRGLFRFLRFIERMQDRGDDLGTARALGEQEDVVRIMTIHSSKGLEFPIVFVAGLSKPFNMSDLNQKYLLDKELGFASKYIDPKKRISYPTLPLIAMKKKMKMEMLSEELRVLYVALTRAKEKLILIGTLKNKEKTLKEWQQMLSHSDWLIPDFDRAKAKCYMDWIGPAVIRHKDAQLLRDENVYVENEISNHPAAFHIELLHESSFKENEHKEEMEWEEKIKALHSRKPVLFHSEWNERVQFQLNWKYPYEQAAKYRSKQSVSEIKRAQLIFKDEYSDEMMLKTNIRLFHRPKFLQDQSLSPAEKGTVMHIVMQHLPFHKDITRESLDDLIDQLVKKEILTKPQTSAIQYEQILDFLNSEIGKRLKKAAFIEREVPFSFAFPASELYQHEQGALQDEAVLVQGVIDCLFEDEEGFVLLDYKTDTVTGRFSSINEAIPVLEKRYDVQMKLYEKAVETILNRKITEKYLYFFDGGFMISL